MCVFRVALPYLIFLVKPSIFFYVFSKKKKKKKKNALWIKYLCFYIYIKYSDKSKQTM